MSFGLAFAQGLVGGFTKNIEREQIKRDEDDQRLAGLQDMLFQGTIKSAQDGTPMPQQIGDMLKKAKADIANRPDIGPFGRGKADRLNLDFDKLSGDIDGISKKDNYLVFGNKGLFKVPLAQSASTYHTDKAIKKDLYNSAYFFNNTLMPYLDTDEGRRKLIDAQKLDPTVGRDLKQQYELNKKQLIEAHMARQRENGVPKAERKVFNFHGVYGGNKNTTDWLDNYTGLPEGTLVRAVEADSAKSLLSNNPAKENTLFFLVDDKRGGKKELSLLDLPVSAAQYSAAGEIAKLKFGSEARPSDWIFYQQQNTYGGIFETSKRLFSGEENPQDRIRKILEASFLSMNLVKNGYLTSGRQSTDVKLNAIKELIKATKGDRILMAMAMSPLIKRELTPGELASKSPGLSKYIAPPKITSMKTDFNIDKKEFDKGYQSTYNAFKKIEKILMLEDLRSGNSADELGDNLARKLYTGFQGAFAEGGAVSGIFGVITGSGGVVDAKKDTDAAFQGTIMQMVERGVLSSGEKFSLIDALKLSVAADMARAIDPNGRLSNQDFSIQLERLGTGIFSSKGMTMIRLRQVKEEFENKYDRLQVINNIFTINDKTNPNQVGLSVNERDLLTADAEVQGLLNTLGIEEITNAQRGGGGLPSFNTENSWINNDFTGPDGGTITIYEGPDGNQRYFVNGQDGTFSEIPPDQLREKITSPKEELKKGDPKKELKKGDSKKESTATESTTDENLVIISGSGSGIVLGDRQPDGSVVRRQGFFKQNPTTYKFDRVQ